ncbi:MAG TPA: CHAD domain-containing protein [Thermoplasmata archaeon]|nr:CHAD domain-containing protein [Thermoplasmata archaeon]
MKSRGRRRVRAPAPPAGAPAASRERSHPLERLRSAQTEMVRLAGAPDPTPEQLHRFHRRLRRLRIEIRLARSLQPPSGQAVARAVDRRLRRLSGLVGEVRDFDVSLGILGTSHGASAPDPSREAFERTRRRLREEARSGRALLGASLRAEIDSGLLREASALLEKVGPKLSGPAALGWMRTAIVRQRRRVDRSLRKARRRPTTRRMHRLRGALRRAHHLVDLAPPTTVPPFPSRLARLQRELGRLHDLDVVADGLEGLGDGAEGAEWIERIERRRRALRREIVTELGRRALRERVREIGT